MPCDAFYLVPVVIWLLIFLGYFNSSFHQLRCTCTIGDHSVFHLLKNVIHLQKKQFTVFSGNVRYSLDL